MSLPILSSPVPEEDLYMYLAISNHTVSVVLLRVRDGVQWPMYYINKTLVEKLVLALVHTTRKLPHYFQAHTVYVLIEHPLQS